MAQLSVFPCFSVSVAKFEEKDVSGVVQAWSCSIGHGLVLYFRSFPNYGENMYCRCVYDVVREGGIFYKDKLNDS